jgi:hypothetical protein
MKRGTVRVGMGVLVQERVFAQPSRLGGEYVEARVIGVASKWRGEINVVRLTRDGAFATVHVEHLRPLSEWGDT